MKQKLINLLSKFDLDDHDYIRFEFGIRPWFKGWITLYPEERRWNLFRKIFPWRLRLLAAHYLIKRLYSTCTRCGKSFSLHELVYSKELIHHLSGSVCHRDCEPTPEFSAMLRRMSLGMQREAERDR